MGIVCCLLVVWCLEWDMVECKQVVCGGVLIVVEYWLKDNVELFIVTCCAWILLVLCLGVNHFVR